jgi:hypothetical protein
MLFHTWHIFGKKVIEHQICLFWFSLQYSLEKFLILKRTERDMIINLPRSSCEVPVNLVKFQWKILFLSVFRKILNIKFHENPSIGSRFVPCGRTDRQKGMTKRIVAFRNFVNTPKRSILLVIFWRRECEVLEYLSSCEISWWFTEWWFSVSGKKCYC